MDKSIRNWAAETRPMHPDSRAHLEDNETFARMNIGDIGDECCERRTGG